MPLTKKINPMKSDKAKLKWRKLGMPLYIDLLEEKYMQ